MDMPSHVLWTYAIEKAAFPQFIAGHHEFVVASLVFSALPDVLETKPFLIYLLFNQKKFNLNGLKSVVDFAWEINHNMQDEYHNRFNWAAQISFHTHSFLWLGAVTFF